MQSTSPFEAHHERYDAWYERHPAAYSSELLALRLFVPMTGRGLEIGVGTGRFAAPLGVQVGVDPSPAMLALYRIAPLRGIVDPAWQHENWESPLEFVWADAQNRVSKVQCETSSPGYGLVNLRLAKTFFKSLRVEAGVENLLDKRYAEHHAGDPLVRKARCMVVRIF